MKTDQIQWSWGIFTSFFFSASDLFSGYRMGIFTERSPRLSQILEEYYSTGVFLVMFGIITNIEATWIRGLE